jgi:pimeloyl-ACP methyl ester carboxylesterase
VQKSFLADAGTEMSAGIERFLSMIGVDRANFVGSSLGGYLAQNVALRSPEMVEQLVIANGFCDVRPVIEKLPPISAVAATDAAQLVGQNLQSLLAMAAADEGQVRLKAVVKALVGAMQTLENYESRLLLMMGAYPLAAPSIAPERAMIIDDDHDPLLPPEMRDAVRDRFKRSEQHAIDGGGHLPAIQRPAQFADLLRRRLVRDA